MLARKIRGWLAGNLSKIRVAYYRSMGITIGKNCYISLGAHIDIRRGKITIGDNVSISSGSYILGHTGHRPLIEGQETKLEDDVKVFVNAVIQCGVTVGHHSMVGAGAVVAKDVSPYSLVIGNPARKVQHLADIKSTQTPKSNQVSHESHDNARSGGDSNCKREKLYTNAPTENELIQI